MEYKAFHNTTGLVDQELIEATIKARTQQEIIHLIFQRHPEPKTPFEVAVMLVRMGYKYPITSVRARMTALTKEGYLVMSANADALGEYNAKNHTWRLRGWNPEKTQ